MKTEFDITIAIKNGQLITKEWIEMDGETLQLVCVHCPHSKSHGWRCCKCGEPVTVHEIQ